MGAGRELLVRFFCEFRGKLRRKTDKEGDGAFAASVPGPAILYSALLGASAMGRLRVAFPSRPLAPALTTDSPFTSEHFDILAHGLGLEV
jgi:hypothetical protein